MWRSWHNMIRSHIYEAKWLNMMTDTVGLYWNKAQYSLESGHNQLFIQVLPGNNQLKQLPYLDME